MEYFKEQIGITVEKILEMLSNVYEEKWALVLLIICSVILLLWLIPRMFDYH